MIREWIIEWCDAFGHVYRSSYYYRSNAMNVMLDLAERNVPAVIYRRREVKPDEWE